MVRRMVLPLLEVLRRFYSAIARPLFRFVYLQRPHTARIGDIRLSVPPGIFPPHLFVSSRMLTRHVRGDRVRGKQLLDMGTGSGVVGIYAEKAGASVLATDINPLAVATAKANAELNGCCSFESRESDLFDGLGEFERFDLIAWNPPFYPAEPRTMEQQAWYAGSAYALLRRFSAGAPRHLQPGGSVVLVCSSDLDLPVLWSIFACDHWKIRLAEIRKGFFVDHLLLELSRRPDNRANGAVSS